MRALDPKGLPLGEAPFAFKGNERETEATFDLPVEIRNDIARLEVAGERSSGVVQLLDKRWRRRTVGVDHRLDRRHRAAAARLDLLPLARAQSVRRRAARRARLARAKRCGSSSTQNLPMLILADVGNVAGEARERLAKWIDDGGVLVRFAGPRLAAADDDLIPVKLRRGGRTLGGSLSLGAAAATRGFSRESPFNGMAVPNDVTVTRQVLAEPDSGLTERTWATLADGTPLVTAARRGKGVIVLFHVTADTRWSDLPLSGAFVDMLKRIVALAGSTANAEKRRRAGARAKRVPPNRVLDGFGAFTPPPSTARPVPAGYTFRATADHPPGFYGPPEGLLAVNTLHADRPARPDRLRAALGAHRGLSPRRAEGSARAAVPGALALLVIDALVVFWLAGGLYRLIPRRRIAAARCCSPCAAATLIASQALAQGRPAAPAQAASRPIRRRKNSPRRSRPKRASPTSSPAMPRSTTSASRACRA